MKRNLESYIIDLLYRYDIVIVPDFGAFVSRRKPARYDESAGTFFPPSKEIAFNMHIKQNDGLLTDHIAREEEIDKTVARNFINNTVNEWREKLSLYKRLRLNGIGVFVYENGFLTFVPIPGKNYLAESFGLPAFVRYKPETTNEPEPQRELHTPASEPSKLFLHKKEEKPSSPAWWKYAAAVIAGLAIMTTAYLNYSSGNNIDNNPVQHATYVLPDYLPPVHIQPARQSTSASSFTRQQKTYYIIAGAFRYRKNAEKMLRRLQKSGFPAKMAGQNAKGYYLVAYDVFSDPADAQERLKEIKQSVNPQAWIK